ncbi:MAG TPA: EF-hand domain-containing protein [Polyangiaceae bacterium]|jgi:Ca2+-binding EF-hand superfamily protein|nr:EF-hand domain-containing protein [Polyangiaceae bacterium]
MQTKMVNWALTGAIVLATGLGCSVAAGQTPQPNEMGARAEGAQAGHDPARFVQRFDKNGNGTVELAELPERMQKWLAKADTNNDGAITVDELKAHAQARRDEMFKHADKNNDGALSADETGRRWERLQVADADHNGSVTRAELDQARAEGKLRGPDHKGHHGAGGDAGDKSGAKGHGRMFERFDKNNDGALTSDEVKEGFWQHLVKADANNDGKVTKEELEAARAAHGKR